MSGDSPVTATKRSGAGLLALLLILPATATAQKRAFIDALIEFDSALLMRGS